MDKVVVVCQEQDLEQVTKALNNKSNIHVVPVDVQPNLSKIYTIKQKITEKLKYYQRPRSISDTVVISYR